jgi:hypothetical protein
LQSGKEEGDIFRKMTAQPTTFYQAVSACRQSRQIESDANSLLLSINVRNKKPHH